MFNSTAAPSIGDLEPCASLLMQRTKPFSVEIFPHPLQCLVVLFSYPLIFFVLFWVGSFAEFIVKASFLLKWKEEEEKEGDTKAIKN